MIPEGYKPSPFRTGICRSIQLSYGTIEKLRSLRYKNLPTYNCHNDKKGEASPFFRAQDKVIVKPTDIYLHIVFYYYTFA